MEGVHFVEQLAVFIPLLTQFRTAADMRQRKDKTAVEQAKTAAAESGIHTTAIGAVSVNHQRIAVSAEQVVTVNQRNRHFYAIARSNPHTFTSVVRRIKTLHFLLFKQCAFSGIQIQFEQRTWRSHR